MLGAASLPFPVSPSLSRTGASVIGSSPEHPSSCLASPIWVATRIVRHVLTKELVQERFVGGGRDEGADESHPRQRPVTIPGSVMVVVGVIKIWKGVSPL